MKNTLQQIEKELIEYDEIGKGILDKINIETIENKKHNEIYTKVDALEIICAKKYIEFCTFIINNNILPPRKKGRDIIINVIKLFKQIYKTDGYGLDTEIAKIVVSYIIVGRHRELFIKAVTEKIDKNINEPNGRVLNKFSHQDLSDVLLFANQLCLVNSLGTGLAFLKSIADRQSAIKMFSLNAEKIKKHIRKTNIFLDILSKTKKLSPRRTYDS